MKEGNYWMWLRVLGICACQMGAAFCDLSSPLNKYIYICICRDIYIYICICIYVCIRTELLAA